jgi:hypothetical protein
LICLIGACDIDVWSRKLVVALVEALRMRYETLHQPSLMSAMSMVSAFQVDYEPRET